MRWCDAMASVLRATCRAMPTTAPLAWYWAKDCSISSRAASRPSRSTRLTAML